MLVGHPPFYSRDVQTMFRDIIKAPLRQPSYVSASAKALIAALLVRDPSERLGSRGGNQVRLHRFFRSLDFEKVLSRSYTPAFQPVLNSDVDAAYFDDAVTSAPVSQLIDGGDDALDDKADIVACTADGSVPPQVDDPFACWDSCEVWHTGPLPEGSQWPRFPSIVLRPSMSE
jgi:serine/threonine protein kinase